MLTSTLCLLQDQIEAADDAVVALERDIFELDQAYTAIAAVRTVQIQYKALIDVQRSAIDELRKLGPDRLQQHSQAG